MKKTVFFLILMLMVISSFAHAGSSWAEEKTYKDKVVSKLQFALTNVMLGWTEIIAEPERALDEKKNFFTAMGRGFVYFAVDTLGGVAHLVTFPIPQVDIPLPNNGVLS